MYRWNGLKFKKGFLKLGKTENGELITDLNEASSIWIEGRTGSGKTMLLKSIIKQLVEQDEKCIVLDIKNNTEYDEYKFNNSYIDTVGLIENMDRAKEIIKELSKTKDAQNNDEDMERIWVVIDDIGVLIDEKQLMDEINELISFSKELKVKVIMASQAPYKKAFGEIIEGGFAEDIGMLISADPYQEKESFIYQNEAIYFKNYHFDPNR